MIEHNLPVRIYYEDTDAGGVTYHASYIRFCERGRTEYLRNIGFQNTDILDEYGILFVVRHLEADYNAPAFLDDLLELKTSVLSMKNTSFVMQHLLENSEKTIFEMKVVIACVNKQGKPDKIPDKVRKALQDG